MTETIYSGVLPLALQGQGTMQLLFTQDDHLPRLALPALGVLDRGPFRLPPPQRPQYRNSSDWLPVNPE